MTTRTTPGPRRSSRARRTSGSGPGTPPPFPGLRVPAELTATTVGARQIGNYSQKECDALHVLVASGADPTKVSGLFQLASEISRAALTTGDQHEDGLLATNAARLVQAAVEADRLAPGEIGCVDMEDEFPIHNRMHPAEKARLKGERARRTLSLLLDFVDGRPTPAVIAHATFAIVRPDGRTGYIELDALLLSAAYGHIRPVEIKTFHNADGHTDQNAMRSLQRQGAVEVYALVGGLTEVDARLGLTGDTARGPAQPATVDIVLRGPRLFVDLDVAGPLKMISRLLSLESLDGFEDIIADAAARAGQATPELTRELFEHLPYRYGTDCRDFCALAPACRRRADDAGELELLGPAAAREFSVAGSLPRAQTLLAGGAPVRPEERALADGLTDLDRQLTMLGLPGLRAAGGPVTPTGASPGSPSTPARPRRRRP